MKKLLLVPIFLMLAAVLIFTSCGGTATTTATQPTATQPTATQPTATQPTGTQPIKPEPYGTITIGSTDFSYESTDPVYYESFWGWSMYEPIITWDPDGNYVGNDDADWACTVADSWSISEDGNTWTFKIHKGLKAWNGEPITAEDVKWSVDRFGDMTVSTNPWSFFLSTMYNTKSTAVIDDYTFEFVTNHPEPALVVPFAWTRVLPKDYFESVGQEEFRKNPMGSGPWKFVEHTPETSFTMEANTDYWNPLAIPEYKTLKYLQVPEEATQVAMLKRGELDMVTVNMDRIVALQKAGWKTVEFGFPALINLTVQGSYYETAGPVHDIRVRQALSYAINRQEICDSYYLGNAVPGGMWFMSPGSYGWKDSWLNFYSYDPDKAKALLAEAGYPDAWEDPVIHMYISPGSGVDFMQIIQGYWRAVGIDCVIEIVDSVVYGGLYFSFGPLAEDAQNVGWIFPWFFNGAPNSTYHASNMYTSTGVHHGLTDPTIDAMYAKYAAELDPVKALKYWQEFQEAGHAQYINIGICMVKPLVISGPNLGAWSYKTWVSSADSLAFLKHP